MENGSANGIGEAGGGGDSLVPSVERAFDVLEYLEVCEGRPTLSEIAARLNLPKASAYRLLATLKARGYVEQNATRGGYALAARVLGLAARAEHQLDIVRVAYEPMQVLVDATGEACQLSVLSAGRALCVARIAGSLNVDVPMSRIGAAFPLHAAAVGKALLAFLAPEEIERHLANPLTSFTPNTKTTPEILRRDLEEIRRTGIAHDDQEYNSGLRAFAAPVFNHDGGVAASLGVPLLSGVGPGDDPWEIKEALKATAHSVSRALGHHA